MRSRTPDLLKGIAVILMIQVHITELFATQDFYNSFTGSIFLFLGGIPAAPVFMAIMGYYLARTNKGLKFDLIRGLKLLVWGFALNIGLNLNLFYHIYTGAFILSPWEYLFGVDILFLAGLSVIIIALLKHFFRKKVWVYVTTLILIISIPVFFLPPKTEGLPSYLTAYFYSDAWWSYFPVIPWLAYVLLGFIFNLQEHRLMPFYKSNKWYIISAIAILLTLTFGYGFEISTHLEQYYHHSALFFGFAVLFIALWSYLVYQLTQQINNRLTNYIEWIGKNVTSIYVFQWLIIGNLTTIIYKTQQGYILILWLIFVLFLSSLFTLAWQTLMERRK
jgi:uncharacterized membrane protein